MRATDIKILTMGSALLITSAAAMAGPPSGISYGGFTSNANGVISADQSICGATKAFTCGAELTGNGFYQRSLTANSGTQAGKVFYQTIILPSSTAVGSAGDLAALSFADENFIQQGGGLGIADKQHNYAAGTTSQPGNITSTTDINAGWAQGTGPVVTLTQNISDPYTATTAGAAAHGSDFFLDFGLAGDGTQATQLKINQSVSLCKDVSDLTCTDKQILDVRRKIATSADVTASGGLTSALPTGATLVGPSQISYAQGDIIQVVWLGQTVTTNDTGGAPDAFGFQGYTNVTNQDSGSTTPAFLNSYSSQTDTGPFGTYDSAFTDGGTVFGTAPTF